jgi:hypothetical protein
MFANANASHRRRECDGLKSCMLHGLLRNLDRSMIVAMVTMRMMESAIDQVINVVAVRNCLVAAAWTMFVFRIMASVATQLVTAVRIGLADRNRVFLDSTALLMAQVTIV